MALLDQMAEHDCVLTLQALAEFFHAITRKHKMPAEDARAMLQDWMTLFPAWAHQLYLTRDTANGQRPAGG